MAEEDEPSKRPISAPAAVINLAGTVITGLTPQFLALIMINAVFVGGLLWFLHVESVARVQTFGVLMDACSRELTKGK